MGRVYPLPMVFFIIEKAMEPDRSWLFLFTYGFKPALREKLCVLTK